MTSFARTSFGALLKTPNGSRFRSLVLAAVLFAQSALLACAHHSAQDIVGRLRPLTGMRTQVVANVAAAKSTFAFPAVDQLKVCYGDLAAKVGDYSGLLTQAIQSGAFDATASRADATAVERSIGAFNDCELKLQRGSSTSVAAQLPLIDSDWVAGFEQSAESYWARDGDLVRSLSADDKRSLIAQVESATAWPQFDEIPKTVAPSS